MKTTNYSLPRAEIIILLSGLIALIIFIFIYNRPPFYDEDEYLSNVAFLQQYGFGKTYLNKLVGSAGPLYSVVHFIFSPLTQLHAPYIRLVNIGFLMAIIYAVGNTLNLLRLSRTLSLNIAAIPLTYLVAGLALTEVPAMFFLSISLYTILQINLSEPLYPRAIMSAILAGLCMSLAILGRQPYLLILIIIPVLFIDIKNYKKTGVLLFLTLIFSLALPCYVFNLWNGLVPPLDGLLYRELAKQGIPFRPEFFILCLYHYAIILVIIAPGFFILPGRKETFVWLLTYVGIAAANLRLHFFQFLPFKTIINVLLPDQLHSIAESLGGAFLVVLAIYFLTTLFRQIKNFGYRKEFVFYAVASMLVALACTKITWGFDSRYAAQALPLLIPLGSYFYKRSRYNILRITAGLLVGFKMLHNFYMS